MEDNNQQPKRKLIPTCHVCNRPLTFLMPDGTTLHCVHCNKYFKNEDGKAGMECGTPYIRKNVLY